MSSPVYAGSRAKLQSGMMLQIDIIIQVKGYGGINAEDGIALADNRLREELRKEYPEKTQYPISTVEEVPIPENIPKE